MKQLKRKYQQLTYFRLHKIGNLRMNDENRIISWKIYPGHIIDELKKISDVYSFLGNYINLHENGVLIYDIINSDNRLKLFYSMRLIPRIKIRRLKMTSFNFASTLIDWLPIYDKYKQRGNFIDNNKYQMDTVKFLSEVDDKKRIENYIISVQRLYQFGDRKTRKKMGRNVKY